MTTNVIIIHGTEGSPNENWFPWLKHELEARGYSVTIPQFPSPPIVPANIVEWYDVWKTYEDQIDEDTIIIGHSLGGIFTLRILEKLLKPIKAAIFVGTPIGEKPILYYDRDNSFSGFEFDWDKIRANAGHFVVYHSDDDPYVDLANGRKLSKNLGVDIDFVPSAGHFNTDAGYSKFELLKEQVLRITSNK